MLLEDYQRRQPTHLAAIEGEQAQFFARHG
jgi:hypothetical protein